MNSPSPATGLASPFSLDDEPRRSWLVWLLVLFLVILLHILVSLVHLGWFGTTAPLRVDLQPIDARKLEEIKRKWKEKDLLLDRDKNKPSDLTAPDNSKYMSDRNIHVDKEQRAKTFDTIPKLGAPGPKAAPHESAPPRKEPRTAINPLPDLGNLGVKFKFPSKPEPPRTKMAEAGRSVRSGDEGANQYIRDKTVPEGAEDMLNAQESVYYSFYSRLYESVAPVWQSRIREIMPNRKLGEGEYMTVVDIVMDQDGHIVDIQHTQNSNVPEFDKAVDFAWRRIGRFPNPPEGLLDPQGLVHIGWTFTVQLNGNYQFDYPPPERIY